MPKEKISSPADLFEVHVGWANERDVQLGLETVDGYSLVTQLYGSLEGLEVIGMRAVERGWPMPPAREGMAPGGMEDEAVQRYQSVGRDLLNLIEASSVSPEGSYSGVWATLDRAGANRLIRVLRRARDAAFGADA